MLEGMVFNIQRYSIDDGPGIRTTVFLKGCPLRCLWCSNPESQNPQPELMHRFTLCRMCGRCASVCPKHAIQLSGNQWSIDRKLCDVCGRCVSACWFGALKIVGDRMSVDEVLTEILKDKDFYIESRGGVTLSGGEPLFQAEFTLEFFRACKAVDIHTCLDTSGYGDEKDLKEILRYTDLVYYDFKHPDPELHRKATGVDNSRILKNLEMVVSAGIATVVRVPLIPGFNDDKETLVKMGEILKRLSVNFIHILPYHKYGVAKYKMLGRDYALAAIDRPDENSLLRAKRIFEDWGMNVSLRI